MTETEMDMYRTEGVHAVLTRGIRKSWDADQCHAHGASGQKNPLGNALNHLLVHPSPRNAQVVVSFLAAALVRLGICKERDSVDLANDAARYWHNPRCTLCGGNGVVDFEQTQCPKCEGTGREEMPSHPKLREAIGVINSNHEWMEMQLRKRLAI